MPRATQSLPSQAYLLEILDYDPLTGKLTWKERPSSHFKDEHAAHVWNTRYSGKEAGRSTGERNTVAIDYIPYNVPRLIWKLVTGNDPLNIDHKDTNPLNQKWDNLREATRSQNGFNRPMNKNNTTGYKGVTPNGRNFMASTRINGKRVYLGTYKTAEEAYEAYCKAVKELHGEFFHPG